jgi:accessory secretory protein Asp1
MDEVVQEVLSAYLELLDKDDLFCIAMHEQHNAVLQETLKNRKKIQNFIFVDLQQQL